MENRNLHPICKSMGCMQTIGLFLGMKETVKMQHVNKYFYSNLVPRIIVKVEMPYVNLVLENQRKHISIGFWKENTRECLERRILSIGEGAGEISPSILGFQEIYFQYFVWVDHRTYAAFPLEQEAILKKGFLVTFDSSWKFLNSEPLPELDENTMRPTACLLNGPGNAGRRLLMLGGR